MVDKTLEEYTKFYENYTDKAVRYHADTTRKDFQAQLWYELTRNKITLSMLGNLCEGKDVLDLGSAHWVEKALLAVLKAKTITKVDIAPAPDDAKDTLKLDACDTKLPSKSYDVIICRELIEHVIDADKLMAEIVRLLKDDGFLFIATPNAFGLPPDMEAHVRGYTPRSFEQTLERYGFKILDKRGNCQSIFLVLMPLVEQGYQWVLDEFKEIERYVEATPKSYYFGTNMFVLAKKGHHEDIACAAELELACANA
jgi:2-polyprenyl-3-methyl-5-hydroxy-6-metoxy-1,4-benzoquinol methylase